MDAAHKIYRLFAWVLSLTIFWLIFPFVSPVMLMIIIAFILTSIFLPIVDKIERSIGNRSISVFFVMLTSFISFFWFLGSFLSNFGYQIKIFSEKLKDEIFVKSLTTLWDKVQFVIPNPILNLIPESSKIVLTLQGKLDTIFQNILSVLSTTGNILLILVMSLIFTIIILVEYYSFKRSLVQFIPNKYFELGLRLIYNIEQQVSKFLMGQLLAASTVAIMSIAGLFILNKMGANLTLIIFIGIIAGFANLIPMIGPFVGMVPAILISIMNNMDNPLAMSHYLFGTIPSPFFILDIILMFFLIQQIDNNFVTPIVVGESTGLHPMLVMISLLIGGFLLGPIGMLFAVPAAGIFKVIINELIFISKNSHLL
tara:strand:- start:2793 stop:3899 length:1107 start_codon:yes stop_codon:yes gene_type:complete